MRNGIRLRTLAWLEFRDRTERKGRERTVEAGWQKRRVALGDDMKHFRHFFFPLKAK